MKTRLSILGLLLLVLTACTSAENVQVSSYVDLSDQQPLPTPTNGEATPLRVALAAVISPKGTVESYAPFLDYLSDRLDRPVELVTASTHNRNC